MSPLPEQVCTRRLLLRVPVDRDIPEIVRGLANLSVSRWLGRVPYPYVSYHARRWLASFRRNRLKGRDLNFVIARVDRPERVIGGIGCQDLGSPEPAIGYWLAEAQWGKGYMSEALDGLLGALVAMKPGIRPIATAMPDNRGSLGVLKKAGFVRERQPRIHMNAAQKRKVVVVCFRWLGPEASSGGAGKGNTS